MVQFIKLKKSKLKCEYDQNIATQMAFFQTGATLQLCPNHYHEMQHDLNRRTMKGRRTATA